MFVTLPVNFSTLLTTELAAFSTPETTVLAKSAPGSVGSVTGAPPPDGAGVYVEGEADAVLALHGR